MTKKRFNKLLGAYFTRLNAWGVETGHEPLHMGIVYSRLPLIDPSAVGKTRAEWWKSITDGNSFGVGVKES